MKGFEMAAKKKKKKSSEKKDPLDEFDFFDIDENNLVNIWCNQPKLFFRYATMLTEARTKVEELKATIGICQTETTEVKAKLDLAIRKDFEKYGLPKLTETGITNVILSEDSYQEKLEEMTGLNTKMIKRKKRVGILEDVKEALNHRKAALQSLVQLHGQNYYASPFADGVAQEVIDDLKKKAARGVSKKTNKD